MSCDLKLLLVIIGSIVGFYLLVFLVCWLRLKLHKKHDWVNANLIPSLEDIKNNKVRQRCRICGKCRIINKGNFKNG